MKVIFLDIDGVIATPGSYERGCFSVQSDGSLIPVRDKYLWYGLDSNCITRVNRLIEATGANIVISSTWRLGSEEKFANLCKYLRAWNLKGAIIGRTPVHNKFSGSRGVHWQRGDEIKEWLEQNPKVTNFVVLDDDDDFDAVRNNFIRTTGGWDTGLHDKDVDKAIKVLNHDV